MKNSKQTKQDTIKNIVYDAFMTSPIPSCISTLKDGIFVDINDAGARYVGKKREDIIGRKSTELGIMTEKERQLLVDEINKDGFVRNIPLKFKVDDQVVDVLCAINKFKHGKEDLLFCFMYSIPKHIPHIESSKSDLFYRLALLDLKYIKDRLKQYPLTPKQKEIAILSAAGKSNNEIAKELNISELTVKVHLRAIFKTIGISHRSELIPKLLNL